MPWPLISRQTMTHSERHLLMQLSAAEREIERQAVLLSTQADTIARQARELQQLRPKPILRRWSAHEGWHTVVKDDDTEEPHWRAA